MRSDDWMQTEVRTVLRWMADAGETNVRVEPAVRKARKRLARTATVAAVSFGLAVYGVIAGIGALGGTRATRRLTPPASHSAGGCPSRWTIVPSADVAGESNSLDALAVLSDSDVWAVGHHYQSPPHYRTLIEHWDGAAWSLVNGAPVRGDAILLGVGASAPGDVWAVGYAGAGTLVEHWDGANWSRVSAPSPPRSQLGSVVVISASDSWAVGSTTMSGRPVTLTLHWDGTAWRVVHSPNVPGRQNILYAVSASGPGDVWAVGGTQAADGTDAKTLALHWNGVAWAIVPTPSAPADAYFSDVAAISPTDAWAIGDTVSGQALVARWDGSDWSLMESPVPQAWVNGVTAFGPQDVWIGGRYATDPKILTERWGGQQWVAVPAPSPSSTFNALSEIQGSAGRLWAVGAAEAGGLNHTLVLRGCMGG